MGVFSTSCVVEMTGKMSFSNKIQHQHNKIMVGVAFTDSDVLASSVTRS